MKTGLYCYWGALGDHERNAPGHPLYQVFCLDTLADFLALDKIYFYSFYKNKVEQHTHEVEFYILKDKRTAILKKLQVEIVSFKQAMQLAQTVDATFLKARFRNKSRLEEKSFDALKFEKLIEIAPAEKTYVIDSDGELPLNFFTKYPVRLLTYFADLTFYAKYDTQPAVALTIPPTLVRHFSHPKETLHEADDDLVFIGNEGLKSPKLSSWLNGLAEQKLKVLVQGKWTPKHNFEILKREKRQEGFLRFGQCLATLQLSKEKYCAYQFLSPRIYEANLVGAVVFSEKGYLTSTQFTEVDGVRELTEKLKCLREGFARDFASIVKQQHSVLQEIEDRLKAEVRSKLLENPRKVRCK
jgi:hypothetical protein